MATKKETTNVMTATSNENAEVVQIKPIRTAIAAIRIVGDTPLITHAWNEKTRKQLAGSVGFEKKEAKQKEVRDPIQEFIDSAYWITEKPKRKTIKEFEKAVDNGARFGMKATAFMEAGNSAAYRLGMVRYKTTLTAAYTIIPDYDDLVEIHYGEVRMREDNVKIRTSTDLRYRPEFVDWWCDLKVSYNPDGPYGLDSILAVINAGGDACGVGEWRREKGGIFGRYHVEMKPV